ncbi:DNA polymerase III subunit delta [Vibrio sp. JC009]|uniref:DNA polymerase III subunit delta n=1 Tax=Vibrio sp. JC009 TaxID=2912314 RepID=UPI0023B0B1C2|nr:DNA polymerase III subunit delta [Vibrio sp. JC009]WED22493.1 DNA polymerase III subunit delta [Vibrio sp. JC009]
MRLFADKLADNLKRQLSGVYLLFGNEPLLITESRDLIYKAARSAGFEERHYFSVDSSINWNDVYDCTQALSLFSSRQIIELEIPESGVNVTISKELVSLSESLHSDIILIVTGSKLTRQQENAKWFKTLNQRGTWVSCLTPDTQRLPGFINTRCRQLGLQPDQEALQMLAQWHEGNLLALVQSLEKLALLYPDGVLTLVRVEEALSRHNHFTPFHWMDALLAGKPKRAMRILRQLQTEGTEPVILLRTLQREFSQLMQLKKESQTQPLGRLFDQYRIWQNKRPLYQAALTRLSADNLKAMYKQLAQAEILAKTQYEDSCWPQLTQLSVEFCSPEPRQDSSIPFPG